MHGATPTCDSSKTILVKTKHNHIIKHVLMDSLEEEYRNVVLDCNAASNMPATDFVELESVQDSFLEMGRIKLPDAVVTGLDLNQSTARKRFVDWWHAKKMSRGLNCT